MLDEITWEQFQEWLAYEEVEPFGDRRLDWLAASICAVVANSAAARSGSRKRFKISDFKLKFDEDESKGTPGQTWQQQKMIAQMFAAVANADEAKRAAKEKRDAERRARRKRPAKVAKDEKPSRQQIDKVRAALRGKK